jgi:hypothetical protein
MSLKQIVISDDILISSHLQDHMREMNKGGQMEFEHVIASMGTEKNGS